MTAEFKSVKVSVDTGLMSLDKAFSYLPPEENELKLGQLVEVPFGRGKKMGIVVGFDNEDTPFKLKRITKVLNEEALVSENDIRLAAYMQKMYVASFHDCLKLLCPPNTFSKEEVRIRLKEGVDIDSLCDKNLNRKRLLTYLNESGGVCRIEELKAVFGNSTGNLIKALIEDGFIEKEASEGKKVKELKRKFVRLLITPTECDEILKNLKSEKQKETLKTLTKGPMSLSEISEKEFSSPSVVKTLSDKGLVEIYSDSIRRNPFAEKEVVKNYELSATDEQKEALRVIGKAVDEEKSDTFLLHGITGSGKTEVFMQVIKKVLEKGKSAIVLVPEISLTPQMTDRFLGRFGEKIAILHSVLSQGERLDEWNRIKRGEAKVVIGARSAVFAPLTDIGIIIVDEEHENTYHSEQSPRYDAREVAKERCIMNNAPLLLASATPDIKSYYKALEGEYKLIRMTKRYNEVKLPDISIADMRKELREGNRSMLSTPLREEIGKNLERGEQTVLFLNRRGFSTFVSCRDCGYVASCPSCSIALTYHKTDETLNCHYCGYKERVIKTCPECNSKHVKYFGAGTQKLEEEIKTIFPSATTIRMDVDTTGKKGSHERILKKFSNEKIDILLGTQMVSKGLDFPDISLVGVMAADMSLNIDDYRASERTFDLITQVSGRAGRGDKPGRAVIQTYNPENPVINMAKAQDYEAFYESEIAYRKMFDYPPFNDIISFVFSSEDKEKAKKASEESEKAAEKILHKKEYTLYKTSEAPVSKINGSYRYRYWIKAKADDALRESLKDIYLMHKEKDVKFNLLINPGSML